MKMTDDDGSASAVVKMVKENDKMAEKEGGCQCSSGLKCPKSPATTVELLQKRIADLSYIVELQKKRIEDLERREVTATQAVSSSSTAKPLYSKVLIQKEISKTNSEKPKTDKVQCIVDKPEAPTHISSQIVTRINYNKLPQIVNIPDHTALKPPPQQQMIFATASTKITEAHCISADTHMDAIDANSKSTQDILRKTKNTDEKPKKRYRVGTAALEPTTSKFAAATSAPKIWMHISKVNMDTTTEDITKYLKDQTKDNSFTVEEIIPLVPQPTFKSFKVSADQKFREVLYSETFWPKGVAYQRYHFKRPRQDFQQAIDRDRMA